MMDFAKIVRDNIKGVQGYSCAREEFEGTGVMLLDANENPFESGYNRYPDPYQRELKDKYNKRKNSFYELLIILNLLYLLP